MANTVNVRSGASPSFGSVARSAILNGLLENNTATTNLGVVDITAPNGAWLQSSSVGGVPGAKWVSYTTEANPTTNGRETSNTYPTAAASGNILNDQSILFAHEFTLGAGGDWSGSLRVLADDTASVWIKDNTAGTFSQLFTRATYDPPPDPTNTFPTCSSVIVGCLTNTLGVAAVGPLSGGKTYTLLVQAFQIAGSGYGINYDLELTQVPEPGFYGVLALGMSGLYLAVRRRRAQKPE